MPQALSMAIQQATGAPEYGMEIAQIHSHFVTHVHL
jgi:hypothetical protein